MIQVIEILTRANQGVTRPFLCKASDGHSYYVKGIGNHAGHRSVLTEWISAHLAQAFGLPIAPFKLIEVPKSLIEIATPDWSTLGTGTAFGSQQIPLVQELQWSQVKQVPIKLQQDILVFDWWIHNADRSLTDKGGNPNLLWSPHQQELTVIDHNNGFDPLFNQGDFYHTHAFRHQIQNVFEDFVTQDDYIRRMSAAIAAFETACNNSPSEWWWIDDGVACSFSTKIARQLLARFAEDFFWRLVL